MPSCFGQLGGQGLFGHNRIALLFLPVVPRLDLRIIPWREAGCFDKRPGQIRVAVALVVFAFLLAVGAALTFYSPAVGCVASGVRSV